MRAADVPNLFVRGQQASDTRLHDLVKKKFPDGLMVEKQRQIVQLLADEMCDPNGRIAEGVTPLHLAVEVNKYLYKLVSQLRSDQCFHI